MNSLTIIGNLCADPETRTTKDGTAVCSFTVAVNMRGDKVEFFRVAAWRKLADICQQYLSKGKKVYVVGAVSASVYQGRDGNARCSLEVNAQDVVFLSPKGDSQPAETQKTENLRGKAEDEGYTQVDDDDLPF